MDISSTPIYRHRDNISNSNRLLNGEDNLSDDEDIVRQRTQLRRQNITDSESDIENTDPAKTSPIKNTTKSRIKKISSSDSDSQQLTTNTQKSSRAENRKIKLYDKFKALSAPKVKKTEDGSDSENQSNSSDNAISEQSDEELSCLKIKKKLVKKSTLSSICDADTSDEDVDRKLVKIRQQKKFQLKVRKSAIEIQPKMSAKQAMKNMQKIKSESNRMLREKDVSLPYHKPRALSLQDIMKRKKPTLTSDGKVMPIKMNDEQLAQYAKLLEERQREIIELCKSDSEDEAVEVDNIEVKMDNIEELENKDKAADNIYGTVMQEQNNDTAGCNISTEIFTEKVLDDNKCSTQEPLNGVVESEEAHKIPGDVDDKVNEADLNEDGYINCSGQDNESITLKYLDSSTENVAQDIENDINNEKSYKETTSGGQDTDNNAKPLINSETLCQKASSIDSQAFLLKFDSDIKSLGNESKVNIQGNTKKNNILTVSGTSQNNFEGIEKEFDNDDFNLDDIDSIIENTEIIKDSSSLNATKRTMPVLPTLKPKLTGSPGMFIDLESGDQQPKVLTGVELLKERYSYFSKLKTAVDMEKNRLQKHKPGLQHLKLKHELEEQIAAQRSLEWEKREEEKQSKSLEPEDDIEKIESKLEKDEETKESSDSEEEDLVEDDIEIKDIPRKSNPMIDDEAEESDDKGANFDEAPQNYDELEENADENDSNYSNSDESSSESEDETTDKPKKGRILKAFEDSDDETNNEKQNVQMKIVSECPQNILDSKDGNEVQDEEMQLAQFNRSISDDIFATQESQINSAKHSQDTKVSCDIPCTADLGSQTFSISDSTVILHNKDKQLMDGTLSVTQSIDESKFDASKKNCTGSLSQDLLMSQPLSSQSQEIGDDIAALCTGKFYDNPFVTQLQDKQSNLEEYLTVTPEKKNSEEPTTSRDVEKLNNNEDIGQVKNVSNNLSENLDLESKEELNDHSEKNRPETEDGNLLKSILDELNEPEVEQTNRFFGAKQESQVKKKFIIDSDDENGEETSNKKKKFKKRKPEKRALQISDDEEDFEEEEESEIEDDVDKVIEYDSEENEIEVQAKPVKKKRIGEFFENEAELTSEDEWMGSGDEDEAGLDRMEREEGDNEVFHQGQLQRELGQIHMREVLDQDKREVRLLQELLFEDGDLGDGHRQRKFRWKNDGDVDDGTGMGDVDLADTQEEEFESEELWRKQRHERELFLKSLQENEEEKPNPTLNRTALIKANLNSSKIVNNHNQNKKNDENEAKPVEPKSTKDVPSPKKPFFILKQSYHGSLLSRGQGALARLAALATPLAVEADAPRPKAATSAPGNFVFATLSQPDPEPKVTKRKAETKADTPRLLKKMKTEQTQKLLKNSLFDHFTS